MRNPDGGGPGPCDPLGKVYGYPGNKPQEGKPDKFIKPGSNAKEHEQDAPATFAGVWQTIQFPQLLLQQAGNQIVGQLTPNNPQMGVIKGGIVDGNTLRFTIWRPPIFFTSGRYQPEEYVGMGELVMDRGSKSFKGTILGFSVSGTLIAR